MFLKQKDSKNPSKNIFQQNHEIAFPTGKSQYASETCKQIAEKICNQGAKVSHEFH